MSVCRRPSCDRPAGRHSRGYCEPDYRRQLRKGRFGWRDPARAREHVARLRALGWTYEQIAGAAGVSTWVPHKLATGGVRHLWPESEAVLRVPLRPAASHRGVDGTGTYRRVEALQWMGWPMAEIAQRVGLRPYTLTSLRSRGELVSARVALLVAAVYEQLAHVPGPCQQAATKARKRGYAPPLAWDDESIDDPDAEPAGADGGRASRREKCLDALSIGYQPWEAARLAGLAERTAKQIERERSSGAVPS